MLAAPVANGTDATYASNSPSYPFDRLLVAQALEGSYTLVTHDDVFESYGVAVLRA